MCDVLLSRLQGDLVDLSWTSKRNESTACDLRVTPVCYTHAAIYPWLDGESVAGPGEECITLCDHPVGCAVEVNDDHGCDRRLCGDESCYWACGGDALIEEWDAEGESSEWLEDGECGLRLAQLAMI